MDTSLILDFVVLLDYFRWLVFVALIVASTFFIYTAILYRLFLLSRQDATMLDLPWYPYFSYMVLRQDLKPATILNKMPKEKIEKGLKGFEKHFKSIVVHSEDNKNAATALAEYTDEHVYKELYIYWDRKSLETHYETELRKNTPVRLEMINKRQLPGYDTLGSTRYFTAGDRAFDAKYTILTNRPNMIKQLSDAFRRASVKEDLDSLIVVGRNVNIKTQHREDVAEIISLLLEFEKNVGKTL